MNMSLHRVVEATVEHYTLSVRGKDDTHVTKFLVTDKDGVEAEITLFSETRLTVEVVEHGG
jgi:hypothetical protein